MFYSLLKTFLFQMDPEQAHEFTLNAAKLGPSLGSLGALRPDPKMNIKVGNLYWSFPVGLAAGLDKNAEALSFFQGQGFGALECGTITLKSQGGNPRPRVWRYPQDQSLRNAMGFPNDGLQKILKRLENKNVCVPVGANIGKNKDTTPEDSIEELTLLFEALNSEVDYFAVNVSSPNTPGLRALQDKGYLTELFTHLNLTRNGKDLYLKIAPDLEESKVVELTELAVQMKLTGIIATNTTIMPDLGPGGISGKLLTARARKIRQFILDQKSPLEVIGVGGISHAEDVFDFWREGGKAVQVYSSYVFQGPALLKNIHTDIEKMLKRNQLPDLSDFFKLSLVDRKKALNQPA